MNNCELHRRLTAVWYCYYNNVDLYRVIHKSFLDFRPLRYINRDGHAEGEHVNRGRDTPSFCPTLEVLDMSTLGDAADANPANSKTQNAFLFPVHAMFRHDCPLAVKPATMPRRLGKRKRKKERKKKKTWRVCLCWLLHSRVRNFRRVLWITLYLLTRAI